MTTDASTTAGTELTPDGPLVEAARRPSVWWNQAARGITSNGTVAILDQAAVSFASFATSVVLARNCSQSQFGIYVMATSLLYFVRGFQEQLVSAPYTIYCHRRRGNALRYYTGNTLLHQLILAVGTQIFIGGMAVALAGMLPAGHGLVQSLVVLLVAAPCFLLREHLRKLNFAHFEFHAALFSDSLTVVVQMALLCGLYFFGRISVISVFIAVALSTGVGSAISLAVQHDQFRFLRSRLWSDWTGNWSFGRWALTTHLIGCSTPYVMPWLVASLRGEAVTGTLGACQSIVGMANMFVTGMSNFLSPRTAEAFARGGKVALRRTLLQAASIFVVTLGGFTLLMLAIGNELAPRLMGKSYDGLGMVMVVLSLALLVNSLGMTAGNGLWAMDRPSLNLSADVTSLVATFVFALMLVPTYGAMGAALATLGGHILSATQRWWVVLRLVAPTPAIRE